MSLLLRGAKSMQTLEPTRRQIDNRNGFGAKPGSIPCLQYASNARRKAASTRTATLKDIIVVDVLRCKLITDFCGCAKLSVILCFRGD